MFRKSQNEENVRKREDLLAILMSLFSTKYRKMIVHVRNSILTNKNATIPNLRIRLTMYPKFQIIKERQIIIYVSSPQ